MNESKLNEAAAFYLKYCGMRGTPKQVEKLIKQVGPNVVAMAKARGWAG